jgi:amino acid adenylation domain-containing protein
VRSPRPVNPHSPALTDAEWQRIVVEWNNTTSDLGPPATVPELVTERAAISSDAIAIADDSGLLSYQELDHRANAVATRLVRSGVGPGSIVGVLLEPSAMMVAAWLGVLKAGAAYLPLDASYPVARLRFMLDDAGVRLVLCEPAMNDLTNQLKAETLTLDQREWVRAREASAPEISVTPSDLAYVIYTSGSTGIPKGVMIEHGNIVNTVRWHARQTQLVAGCRVPQTAAAGFDVATCEIWSSLCAGAELHVVPGQYRQSPRELCRWVAAAGMDIVFLVTPIAQLAIRGEWLRDSGVRTLVTGGEKLNVTPSADTPYRCLNTYGPTETAVYVTSACLANGDVSQPPIGRPIGNTTAYVLDDMGQPVPVGVAGELCIGGAGVGRGYLGRPRMTAEKFIPDPFQPGRRLYRSGDTVRWRQDGQLEFIGRADDQVKVRGFRIELGEVETQLRAHPAVTDAAAAVREPESGYPRLVGYVCGDEHLDVAGIRDWLGERLPGYMVPAALVQLDELPLTPNQKVDRAALPDLAALTPDHVGADGPYQDVFTAGSGERELAEDWRKTCGIVVRSPSDRMIALGGASLDLIALQARVSHRIRHSVPTGMLTLTQSLAEQAQAIGQLDSDEQPRPAHEGSLTGAGSYGQEAIVFLEKVSGTSLRYQYQMLLDGPGEPDSALLRKSLLAVMRNQPVLNSRWVMSASGLTGVPEQLDSVAVRQHTVRTEDLDTLVGELIGQPIRYDDFPLLGWDLIHHEQGTALLHRDHHIVHDGWSVGVFLRLLKDAYLSFEHGIDWSPPDSAMTYFDWARQQRERATGPASDGARRFWRELLTGIPDGRPRLPWPVSAERSGTRSGLRIESLGAARSAQLEAVAARLEVTPFSFLLATFRRLVSGYLEQDPIVIGSGFANREVETRNIVGMFVNVLPLPRPVRLDETVAEAVRAEMALIRAADEYQWLPTAEIAWLTGFGHSLDYTPMHQINFSQQDTPQPELRFGAWRPILRQLVNGYGKTDLDVMVVNRGLQHARSAGRRGQGIYVLRWEHDPAQYPSDVVADLQQQFIGLLEHACANPGSPWPAHSRYRGGQKTVSTGQLRGEEVTIVVRAVWEDVLEIEAVDGNTNFFDVGGDSLSAASIGARLEKLLQMRPKPRVLFDHPVFSEYVHKVVKLLGETHT